MKKSNLLQIIGVFIMLSLASCAPSYLGKTYEPTQNVDLYYDAKDVRRSHTVMGTTDMGEGLQSLDKVQQKIVNLAKAKGADGVIMTVTEEVLNSATSNIGTISDKNKKNSVFSSGSITTNTKQKKINATFIKYD